MKVAIGADHRGVGLKEGLVPFLERGGHQVFDLGAHRSEPPSDYPDVAARVARGVASGRYQRGILICGTGIGMSISANKVRKIRAAHCTSPREAFLSRAHNDANVLTLGGMITPLAKAKKIVGVWFATRAQGGRHHRRVLKIARLEK